MYGGDLRLREENTVVGTKREQGELDSSRQ